MDAEELPIFGILWKYKGYSTAVSSKDEEGTEGENGLHFYCTGDKKYGMQNVVRKDFFCLWTRSKPHKKKKSIAC